MTIPPALAPFRWPEVSPAAAARARLLFRATAPLSLPGPPSWRVTFAGRAVGRPPAAETLRAATPFGEAVVEVPADLLRALFEALEPGLTAPPPAPPWPARTSRAAALLLVELALSPLLQLLERACGGPITLGACEDGGSAAAEEDALRLVFDLGGRRAEGRLIPPPAAVEVLAAGLARLPPPPRLPLTWPLAVRIAAATLPAREVAALIRGDAIVPGAGWLGAGRGLLVFAERWVWEAERQGALLRLVSPRRPFAGPLFEELAMQDPPSPAAETPPNADIGDLPVRLVFELGRLEVTLADVERLAPGQVLELARDPERAIDVLANGRRIGSGEIVSVGGRLAVRLVDVVGR